MSNQVATQPNQQITTTFFQAIEPRMKEAGFSPEKVRQELSFALQHINKSKQLKECTPESLLTAVLNISNIGLSLNPASKESYLIPRWNTGAKIFEAALEPSYVGLVKLLTDCGSVISMLCQLVYSGDQFEIDLANNLNPVLHKRELVKSKRGELIGCYALATLPDKTRQVEYMDIEEINAIRERSETYKAYVAKKIFSCTWVSDYGEMCRKTVIKRIYKYLPRTERMMYVDNAVNTDNRDYMASDDQISYIESLLITSTLDQHQRDGIEMELSVMSSQRASEIISNLKMNQQDRISSGMSYGQTDIKEHLNKLGE